jgi:hypothetical protein
VEERAANIAIFIVIIVMEKELRRIIVHRLLNLVINADVTSTDVSFNKCIVITLVKD